MIGLMIIQFEFGFEFVFERTKLPLKFRLKFQCFYDFQRLISRFVADASTITTAMVHVPCDDIDVDSVASLWHVHTGLLYGVLVGEWDQLQGQGLLARGR